MFDDAGFTLVEVLAALAVFSLAAVGIMQVTAQSVRTADALEQRYAARVVASNILAEALVQPSQSRIGEVTGTEEQLGRTLEWSRFATPVDENLLQVRVTVSDPSTGQILAELGALRAQR
ncbi:MAG: type II secretion system minor pseudopilin GspI [Pseudomonadota bacterium]